METKKVLGIIFSILFIGAFAFCLTWGIINFNKVKQGMSGTGLYTQEDLNKSYEDGYNTALKNKDEYDQLIAGYRDNITTLNDTISQLNSQITTLTNNNRDYQTQVTNLTNIKTQNETTITNLQSTIITNNQTISNLTTEITNLNSEINDLTTMKNNNERTIISLNLQIDTLQNQVDSLLQSHSSSLEEIENLNVRIAELQGQVTVLTNSNSNLNAQITLFNNQILSLSSYNTQLENINTSNQETINMLNNQIINLNGQIRDLNLQMQNNTNYVGSLNNRINELEQSVAYYEQYIANLENGEQVVVTFEFNGSVYNIQIVNKNSIVSVTTPTSNDYVIFNYWTIDGHMVDLSSYQITTNTKFIADITYKYDVNFVVDNVTVNSQIVVKNNYASVPTVPTKTGYEFDGWSTDGVNVIDVSTNVITANTTYIAKFTKLHTVTFKYEDTTLSTITVRNGGYATVPTVTDTTYKIFNGWKVNDVITDVSTCQIVNNTEFVADITYKYDVNFVVDNVTVNSQIVVKNNYASVPTVPTKTGYEFDGWSTDGVNVIDVSTNVITANTTYIAKFTKLHTVTFVVDGITVNSQIVRDGSCASVPTTPTKTGYIFEGWQVYGITKNITNYSIMNDTVFVALFGPSGGDFTTEPEYSNFGPSGGDFTTEP